MDRSDVMLVRKGKWDLPPLIYLHPSPLYLVNKCMWGVRMIKRTRKTKNETSSEDERRTRKAKKCRESLQCLSGERRKWNLMKSGKNAIWWVRRVCTLERAINCTTVREKWSMRGTGKQAETRRLSKAKPRFFLITPSFSRPGKTDGVGPAVPVGG